jgi:Tfp pilus assembly protein PilV
MRLNSARSRAGVALIEVVLGLTILAIVGVGWVALLGQQFMSVRQIRSRERDVEAAASLVEAISATWSKADLDARVGRGRVGAFTLVVGQLPASLYELAVADTLTGSPLIATTLFVRDTIDGKSR